MQFYPSSTRRIQITTLLQFRIASAAGLRTAYSRQNMPPSSRDLCRPALKKQMGPSISIKTGRLRLFGSLGTNLYKQKLKYSLSYIYIQLGILHCSSLLLHHLFAARTKRSRLRRHKPPTSIALMLTWGYNPNL